MSFSYAYVYVTVVIIDTIFLILLKYSWLTAYIIF